MRGESGGKPMDVGGGESPSGGGIRHKWGEETWRTQCGLFHKHDL